MDVFDDGNTLFANRKDAGQKLAQRLLPWKDKNALVLGIPRGGVEIGYYIAKALHAEFSVIISKKLSYPRNEEYGFGAVTEERGIYISDEGYITSEEETARVILNREKEISRRIKEFREGLPLPSMKDKVVIIADDGIATGVTLVPCIRLCRKHQAKKIIVAAPVASRNYNPHINEADEVCILAQPEFFYGVGQVYKNFGQLSDAQVLAYLKKHKAEMEI